MSDYTGAMPLTLYYVRIPRKLHRLFLTFWEGKTCHLGVYRKIDLPVETQDFASLQ